VAFRRVQHARLICLEATILEAEALAAQGLLAVVQPHAPATGSNPIA